MKYEITKGSAKDFEQAPEWATQLLRDNNDSKKSFVGELGGETLVAEKMNPHSWWKYNDGYVGTIIAERRPITEPVWDGEGLPPVGVECEFECNDEGFNVGTVRHIGKRLVIIELDGDENCYGREFLNFRPIRSPEEVARDESIEAMRDVGYTLPAAVRFTKEEMAALYDAGYRKME